MTDGVVFGGSTVSGVGCASLVIALSVADGGGVGDGGRLDVGELEVPEEVEGELEPLVTKRVKISPSVVSSEINMPTTLGAAYENSSIILRVFIFLL